MAKRDRGKQQAYRQSDKGRMTRRMYLMNPEVKQRMAIRREIKRKMKRGY